MRIVTFIVGILAVVFGLIAVAFLATLGFVAAIVRRLFGIKTATPRYSHPSQPPPVRTTRMDSDDAIDVVTTPVKR